MKENDSSTNDNLCEETDIEPIILPEIETADIDLTCILTESLNPLVSRENFDLELDSESKEE